mmetsp:Transcript_35163/g.85086  ORF Transcript_35163/g.85086 Transcript_35163/m.85086 type:complete len:675 (-) Transcript_35163:195-2219(-)
MSSSQPCFMFPCPVPALDLTDGGGGGPFLVYAPETATATEEVDSIEAGCAGRKDIGNDIRCMTIIRPGGGQRIIPPTTALKMEPVSGALIVPNYKSVGRDSCRLLQHSHSENWSKVAEIAYREPHRALHKTKDSGRTALHLAITPKNSTAVPAVSSTPANEQQREQQKPLPVDVAKALLIANRHMVLHQDNFKYTPIHLMAHYGLRQNGGCCCCSYEQDEESTSLMHLLCDTAVMVEQEMQGNFSLQSYAYGASPLYLAAKRRAPVSILRILLQTRRRRRQQQELQQQQCRRHQKVEVGSGMAIDTTTTLSFITGIVSNSYMTNNDPVPVISLSSLTIETDTNRRLAMKGKRNGYWIAPSTGSEPYWDVETMDEYSSPLEVMIRESFLHNLDVLTVVDTIQKNNSLKQTTREMAMQRFGTDRNSNLLKQPTYHKQQQHEATNVNGKEASGILSLWEKCLELLASGGYCPLLQIDGKNPAHLPYGVLHCIVCCKVPVPALVQLAVAIFPEQTLQRDEQGFLPLHHLLRARYKYATAAILNTLLSKSAFCPAGIAAFPGSDGPTPVAYCLKKRLPIDVVNKILVATGNAGLSVVDASKLYPFQLAAVSVEKLLPGTSSQPDCARSGSNPLPAFKKMNKGGEGIVSGEKLYTLNDIYCLLRPSPDVLSKHVCLDTSP